MISRQIVVDLFRAIEINDIQKVRELVEKNPEILNYVGKGKYTPLWQAMIQGRKEIVELLIEFGADPDEKCCVYKDKLFAAECTFVQFIAKFEFSLQKFQIAEVLIKYGADVNLKNYNVEHSSNIFTYDSDSDDDEAITPLRSAIEKGNTKYVELLLKNGARLEGPDWNGQSPAYYAFFLNNRSKCKEILLLLLEYGLNTNFHNEIGETLVHSYICSIEEFDQDCLEIVEILLDSKAPLDEYDNAGYTPLHYAIENQNVELTSLFIERGSDVNKREKFDRENPLTMAVLLGNISLVKLLLNNGAKVNAVNNKGHTALHGAFCVFFPFPNEQIIITLIQNGAKISIEDNNGDSPFYFLIENCQDDKLMYTVIREFAKLSFENPTATEDDMDFLVFKYVDKTFELYMNELSRMASTKFYPPHTYYSVLKMSKKINKLANLTYNQEFIERFESNLGEFPYFQCDLQKILNEAIEVRNNSKIVKTRLNFIFHNLFPDIIVRKLAENLSVDDLPPQ